MGRVIIPVYDVKLGDVVVGQGRWRGVVENIERDGDLFTLKCDNDKLIGPMTKYYSVEIER